MKVAEQLYLPQFVFQSVYVTAIRLDKIEEAFINSHTRNLLQWNLDITKGLGTGKTRFH